MRGLSGVKIDLSVALASDGDGSSARLPPDVESALYRLVQEALSNVIKHAGATRVEVRVVERDRSVSVTVRDDGRGFDPDLDHRGFGLLGMRAGLSDEGDDRHRLGTRARDDRSRCCPPVAPKPARRAAAPTAGAGRQAGA